MTQESKTSVDKKGSICRVCLNCDFDRELGTGLSLFEKYNDCLISEQINELANVSIKEGDGFPDRICPACHLQLQSAYKFKKTCESTNQILLLATNIVKDGVKECESPVEVPLKKECLDYDEDHVDDSFQNDLEDENIDEKPNVKPEPRSSKTSCFKVKCHDCGGIFKNKSRFQTHWKKVHLAKLNIKCPRCLQKFKNSSALISHKNRNLKSCVTAGTFHIECEGGSPVFHCRECNFKTKAKHRLQKHAEIHLENRTFISRAIDLKLECHDCGGFFKTKCKLRTHWKNVHLPQLDIKCSRCLQKFKSFAALRSHKIKNLKSCVTAGTFHIEGEGRNLTYHCKECNFKSKIKHRLHIHVDLHSGSKPYQCHLCPKGYTTKNGLDRHKESVHKMYSFEGNCKICGKFIQGKEKMQKHLYRHRNRKENIECNICKKRLATDEGLRIHMFRHSGVKSFVCEICSKTFFTSSELSTHRRKIHFKIKSKTYICEICGFKTHLYSTMSKHTLRHSDSNVGCNICGIFMENEMQLTLHKIRHTDRHHKCPYCVKTFHSRNILCKHVRVIHKTSIMSSF